MGSTDPSFDIPVSGNPGYVVGVVTVEAPRTEPSLFPLLELDPELPPLEPPLLPELLFTVPLTVLPLTTDPDSEPFTDVFELLLERPVESDPVTSDAATWFIPIDIKANSDSAVTEIIFLIMVIFY